MTIETQRTQGATMQGQRHREGWNVRKIVELTRLLILANGGDVPIERIAQHDLTDIRIEGVRYLFDGSFEDLLEVSNSAELLE